MTQSNGQVKTRKTNFLVPEGQTAVFMRTVARMPEVVDFTWRPIDSKLKVVFNHGMKTADFKAAVALAVSQASAEKKR